MNLLQFIFRQIMKKNFQQKALILLLVSLEMEISLQ